MDRDLASGPTAITLRWQTILLLLGFSCAIALRLVTSGSAGARSVTGGLVFAGCLAALCVAAGVSFPTSLKTDTLTGIAGGLALAAAALLRSGLVLPATRNANGFLPWITVAATVAVSEEAFLRGALYALLQRLHGEVVAVVGAAAAFAGLHVPLYGWHVLPLDFGVGLVLGLLRLLSGSWGGAAVAHVLADAAGWWLR
jgi:membrane protease YdiL (CAAX protease family)